MQPRQIMLVDDEPRLLSALKRRLSSTFEIVTFERGQAALDFLAGPHNVAIVVADMQMPGMNGVELLTQVYQLDPDIRRLMLTGNSDQETASAAINEAKVLRFIRKPCDALVLKDILLEALEEFEFKKADLAQITSSVAPAVTVNQVHRTFLSVMSDELRTPLSQIITISGILEKNGRSTDPKTLENYLSQIHTSGKSVLSHVDRVLRYTRLQSAEADKDGQEVFDIVAILLDAISESDIAAREKLATITFESRLETACIQGFPREVANAVSEVLINAVQYTDVGGHIGVVLKFNQDKIAVRVSNSSAQTKPTGRLKSEKIFKHSDAGLDGASSGLGLGLSLVTLIARRNDFIFDARESAEGSGVVTFVFDRAVTEVTEATVERLRLAS